MQGNLKNINNAVLMHLDVVGNGRVILSLLALLTILTDYDEIELLKNQLWCHF